MTNKILTVILKHNIIRIDFLKIIKGGKFMTLKHIKIFIAVCDTGSMTAASKQLYIAQPAVSFAIAEMENYYGQKLFDRISNRLYITEAGKQFLEYSRQISSLFDEMEDKIKNWDTIGVLRIGANTTIGAYTLPSIIKNFKQTHPDVIVETTIEQLLSLKILFLTINWTSRLQKSPLPKNSFYLKNIWKTICCSSVLPNTHGQDKLYQ